MKVVWLDCSVAAAGDMLLAALLDAGASEEHVRKGLSELGLDGWTLEIEEVTRGAFRAKRAAVKVGGQEEAGGPPDLSQVTFVAHSHDHGHGHSHSHDHSAGEDAGSTGSWRHIREVIAGAAIPARAKERALRAYERLASAEAKLHGVPVDDVVLHEVGSTDAVIDVVGVCLALEDLGAERVIATPLPMGTGRVNAAHGALPLPAPATLQVLLGWPCVPASWPGEWVTPTGAALVAGIATPGPMPAMTPLAVGYGAGKRNPPQVANLVRAVVGEVHDAAADEVVELACNLDDTTGELIAPLLQRLLDAGALDAWATPVLMKKGRPGLVLSALARPEDADRIGEIVLRHSSTLGVRRHRAGRQVLDRWSDVVETPYGSVRVKVGGRDGHAWHASPEFEDVAARAQEAGVPLQEVWRAALAAWKPTP
jgi:uncharacterized protein (TIGR00299 family) protein